MDTAEVNFVLNNLGRDKLESLNLNALIIDVNDSNSKKGSSGVVTAKKHRDLNMPKEQPDYIKCSLCDVVIKL